MTDVLTSVEMADRMLARARARDPHNPLLPRLEALRNEIAEQGRERSNLERRLAQMRLIVDEQAHRIQGGIDRIAELETQLGALTGALGDEYGILDDGGGDRQARTEPIPLPAGNAAMAVELRAKGIFDSGSRRPARLMQRKATGWVEIPQDVRPDDILPGYTEVRAHAEQKKEV